MTFSILLRVPCSEDPVAEREASGNPLHGDSRDRCFSSFPSPPFSLHERHPQCPVLVLFVTHKPRLSYTHISRRGILSVCSEGDKTRESPWKKPMGTAGASEESRPKVAASSASSVSSDEETEETEKSQIMLGAHAPITVPLKIPAAICRETGDPPKGWGVRTKSGQSPKCKEVDYCNSLANPAASYGECARPVKSLRVREAQYNGVSCAFSSLCTAYMQSQAYVQSHAALSGSFTKKWLAPVHGRNHILGLDQQEIPFLDPAFEDLSDLQSPHIRGKGDSGHILASEVDSPTL
jgi:hypothetical protein